MIEEQQPKQLISIIPVFEPTVPAVPPTPQTHSNLYEPAFMRKRREKLTRLKNEKN
jgi:hypothetical protein